MREVTLKNEKQFCKIKEKFLFLYQNIVIFILYSAYNTVNSSTEASDSGFALTVWKK